LVLRSTAAASSTSADSAWSTALTRAGASGPLCAGLLALSKYQDRRDRAHQ